MLFSLRDPVTVAQKLIASGNAVNAELNSILGQITSKELWHGRTDANGRPFTNFADFATAAVPHGLGICTQEAMDTFGRHLYKANLYRPWAELLSATTRRRGRPSNNLAEGENRLPTFTLPTSHSATARQVMILARKHPIVFDELSDCQLSLAEAIRKTQAIKRPPQRRLRFGVLDRRGVGKMSRHAQGRLLCELFEEVGLQAQCRLLAKIVGPSLGLDLASEWRAVASRMNSSEQSDEPTHHPTP
jgi:hypothetical protein